MSPAGKLNFQTKDLQDKRTATTGSTITDINNRDYGALPREGVVVIGSDKITKFYHKRVRAL